ncbi:MAG: hypothetical protein U5L96_10365 [Owenweeksia sp.]|nr:hypothetical protein [Owenweeksia sp.]
MKNFICIVLLMVCSGMTLTAQVNKPNGVVERIKPVVVEAEVVGILQGHKALAVLQIQETDTANAFGAQTSAGNTRGICIWHTENGGSSIARCKRRYTDLRPRLAGSFNPATGQA